MVWKGEENTPYQVKHWRAIFCPVHIRNPCRFRILRNRKSYLQNLCILFFCPSALLFSFTALQCDHMQHNVSIWIIYKLKALKKRMTTLAEIKDAKMVFTWPLQSTFFFGTYCHRKVHLAMNLNVDNFSEIRSVFYALFGPPNLPCYLLKSSGHGRNRWQNIK